jgi:hypothetical protein
MLQINSIEHSPFWEADSYPVCQEIPRPLWNQKINFLFHKSTLLNHILSQINLVHTDFLKAHFNIIILSLLRTL